MNLKLLNFNFVIPSFSLIQNIVCTMGLKWYPNPEALHCIKGCEVRLTWLISTVFFFFILIILI